QTDRREAGVDAARRTLEDGLKAVPDSVPLRLALADLELRAGRTERGLEVLRQGLQASPNRPELRLPLATVLAERGATSELLLQIKELEQIGYYPILTQYLTAYYHVNRNEYAKALQILTKLLT